MIRLRTLRVLGMACLALVLATSAGCAAGTGAPGAVPEKTTSPPPANFVVDCPTPTNIGSALSEYSRAHPETPKNTSLVLARVTSIGPARRVDIGISTGVAYNIYTQVTLEISQTLFGDPLRGVIDSYVPGGDLDTDRSTTDSTAESAWAEDGSIFAELVPIPEIRNGYSLNGLPVLNGRVAFVGTGCWTPIGYPILNDSGTFVVADGGKKVAQYGEFESVLLDDIRNSLP